ncbi:hypothetical protein ACIQUB_29170 [Rhizobium sp. NPDC090275]|uniref:hypothetical protein n=1 Tax=Rhizobium sp. NPDC090275 TaxID=3364498 RepID=UPI00383AF61B
MRQNIVTAWSVGPADEFADEDVRHGNGGVVSAADSQRIEDKLRTEYGEKTGLSDLLRPKIIELYETPASGRKFLGVPKAD